MNSVLKYPGAKNRLAPWIIGFIPEHKVYLEAYFGSGGVFFNKKPASIETINDLNSDVTNYFKVLRDNPEELITLLELTPFGRDEYYAAYSNEECSDIERARRFAVQCFMGFGCSNNYKNGFRSSQQGNSPRTTKAWNRLPYTLRLATERLKDAQIENLPAVELIKRYNTKDVFIYADPPYLLRTRKGYLYKHEMTDEQHVELLETLLKHPGKVLISGYDNQLYDSMLPGWNKTYKDTTAEKGLKRTEVLWMNYNIGQINLEI
jgi:DNA adenine methylase